MAPRMLKKKKNVTHVSRDEYFGSRTYSGESERLFRGVILLQVSRREYLEESYLPK